jgi:hypothetical protein
MWVRGKGIKISKYPPVYTRIWFAKCELFTKDLGLCGLTPKAKHSRPPNPRWARKFEQTLTGRTKQALHRKNEVFSQCVRHPHFHLTSRRYPTKKGSTVLLGIWGATKMPAPAFGRRRGQFFFSTLENKSQAELQHSRRVSVCSRCYFPKVTGITNITVWGTKNYRVEEVERLGAELKFPLFGKEREVSENRKVHVPVPLRLKSVRANIADCELRGLKCAGVNPAALGMHGFSSRAAPRIGVTD